MAQIAFVQEPFIAADLNASPNDYFLRCHISLFNTATGEQHTQEMRVLVLSTDNAQQIEVKLRDALFDLANVERGWNIPVSNIFMPAIRRG